MRTEGRATSQDGREQCEEDGEGEGGEEALHQASDGGRHAHQWLQPGHHTSEEVIELTMPTGTVQNSTSRNIATCTWQHQQNRPIEDPPRIMRRIECSSSKSASAWRCRENAVRSHIEQQVKPGQTTQHNTMEEEMEITPEQQSAQRRGWRMRPAHTQQEQLRLQDRLLAAPPPSRCTPAGMHASMNERKNTIRRGPIENDRETQRETENGHSVMRGAWGCVSGKEGPTGRPVWSSSSTRTARHAGHLHVVRQSRSSWR